MTRRAFTLLELLVAVALLGVLSASVFAFMWHLFDREERALVMARRTQTASVLLDRIERDLLTAVAATPDGPGIVGDDHSLTIAHRAVFVGGAGSPHTDLQRTVIRFDRGRGELSLVREDAFGSAVADRTGALPGGLPGSRPSERAGVLADDIRAVRFRYHDGRTWRSSFTSSKGLPVAVEVAIWFDRGVRGDESEPFEPDDFDPAEEFGGGFDLDPAVPDPAEEQTTPTTEPDRFCVIVIPDVRDESVVAGGEVLP